jgi:hypothetical protein
VTTRDRLDSDLLMWRHSEACCLNGARFMFSLPARSTILIRQNAMAMYFQMLSKRDDVRAKMGILDIGFEFHPNYENRMGT